MKAVVDTNVWLMALPSFSKYRPIVDSFLDGKYQLVVTSEIFLEYEEIFGAKAKPSIAASILASLVESAHTIAVIIHFRWGLITVDPDDNKFTDAYLAAGADYLVTTDGHFDVVKSSAFPKVTIISPDEFLAVLMDNSSQ